MLEQVKRTVLSQPLTVLVTHWWEYFRGTTPDNSFIEILHQTAEWLASRTDVRVISFHEVAAGKIRCT
jgi:hypothetical protein